MRVNYVTVFVVLRAFSFCGPGTSNEEAMFANPDIRAQHAVQRPNQRNFHVADSHLHAWPNM